MIKLQPLVLALPVLITSCMPQAEAFPFCRPGEVFERGMGWPLVRTDISLANESEVTVELRDTVASTVGRYVGTENGKAIFSVPMTVPEGTQVTVCPFVRTTELN